VDVQEVQGGAGGTRGSGHRRSKHAYVHRSLAQLLTPNEVFHLIKHYYNKSIKDGKRTRKG
jgi:hypothetical protein